MAGARDRLRGSHGALDAGSFSLVLRATLALTPRLSLQTYGQLFMAQGAFAIPAAGRVGNLGRNVLHGPTLSQFDLTVQKRFQIREHKNLEFRAELYNLFNRANFANPPVQLNQSLGTGVNQLQPGVAFTPAAAGGAFGVFSSTVEKAVGLGAQRQIQLSLRLNF